MTSWSFLTNHPRTLRARPATGAQPHSGVAGDGQQDPGVAGQQYPALRARKTDNTGTILLVFRFQHRLLSRSRGIPAGDGSWSPGPSKERAMLIVLIIIATIVFTGLYIMRRSQRGRF